MGETERLEIIEREDVDDVDFLGTGMVLFCNGWVVL